MFNTIPTGTKKILFVKSEIEYEVKKQKKDYCKYFRLNKINEYDKYNAYIYDINKSFFVIDIDSEPALDYICSLIEKYNINNIKSLKKTFIFRNNKSDIFLHLY